MFLKALEGQAAYLGLLQKHHAQELYNLTVQNRKYLREWLPWVDTTCTIAETKGFITESLQQYAAGNGFQAGIWCKQELAGVIGLHCVDNQNLKTSIGYWLAEKFQGQGLMTSAVSTCVDFCFFDLKLNRVEIRCATENMKSRAIPDRLGFTSEGIIRQAELLDNQFVNHVVYGLLAEEWRNRYVQPLQTTKVPC